MKTRTILLGLMFLLLICTIAIPARAQAGKPTAPTRQQLAAQHQQQAAQQLQEALQQFRANPSDYAREQIIKLAQSMKPAPAIPEEARGHYVMATTFAEKAKSDTERARDSSDLKLASAGFERAVGEYKAALLAAPWWADAYKKLAIAQKAARAV